MLLEKQVYSSQPSYSPVWQAFPYYITTLPCLNGSSIFVLMGIGLILTGFLLFSQKKMQFRRSESVYWKDGVFTGLLQILSTLPGISRAGTTSTALIW